MLFLALNSRARMILLGAAIAIWLVLAVKTASATDSSDQPQLEIQSLNVTPHILRSGGSVVVDATVVNSGGAPVRNLRLALAVADAKASAGKTAEPEANDQPEPIESLGPGETVNFQTRAKLEGDGWFRVGIVGKADNAFLFPQGEKVHVLVAKTSLFNIVTLFGSYLALVALGALLCRVTLFRKTDKELPLVSIQKLASAAAVIVLLMGIGIPSIIIRNWRSPWSLQWLPIVMSVIFVVGWIAIGVGFRPRKSYFRGLLSAIISYVLIGVGWLIIFSSVFDGNDIVTELIQYPFGSLEILFAWPFQLAQLSGLFDIHSNIFKIG